MIHLTLSELTNIVAESMTDLQRQQWVARGWLLARGIAEPKALYGAAPRLDA